MNKTKLEAFKELLSIPTVTWEEDRLVEYVSNKLETEGYDYEVDKMGNIYVTKGVADSYPLVVAHTDTVHDIVDMFVEEEYLPNYLGENKLALKAYRQDNGRPTGIGGDDKAGVFICLELLEQCDVIKVFLPVSEEVGCEGTHGSDQSFFEDVAYGIQFDSTEGNTMSKTLMGVQLYTEGEEFIDNVETLIHEHGYTEWKHHPYTDIMVLRERHGFECLNFGAGYYDYHTANEYVVVEDVENAIRVGKQVIDTLDNKVYICEGNDFGTTMDIY